MTRSAGHRRDLWPRTIGHPWVQVYRIAMSAMVAAALESVDTATDRRLAREMLESALGLIGDRPETLDLKIAAAALAEMREAFSVFAPYRDVPKVTVFGSARTATNDPLYSQATDIARLLAERGWMVVTGRRPGHHAGGDGRRRPGALDRRVDPPAVRAGRQPGDRRRREVRQHEVLLHPQVDPRQGVAGVRVPARRLRHARRDVRAADPDADRQGLAGADHLPRHRG